MYSVRVHGELGHRLDAEYYNPLALEAEQKIKGRGVAVSLGSKIASGYRVVYHGTDSILNKQDKDLLPFLSPSQIDDNGEIDFESVDKLPLYYKNRYPKGVAHDGELLIEVKGNVSKLAVVPDRYPKNLMISGSLYKASFFDDLNARYALSFLKSRYGQVLKDRLTSNTIINYIAKEDLFSILVPLLGAAAQKYIAGKVLLAEKLREYAVSVERDVRSMHEKLFPSQEALVFSELYRKVSAGRVKDRLDAHHYPSVVEDYLALGDARFRRLKNVCYAVFNGQTRPDAIGSGNLINQITVANLSNHFVKGYERLVNSSANTEKVAQKYDLLICNAAHNKEYIGREVTFYHRDSEVLPSTEVMVIRVDRSIVPSSYVRAYLLSRMGYVQVQSTIRGITAHCYPGDMMQLEIPIPAVSQDARDAWFDADEKMALAGKARELGARLTFAATCLVEGVIDGKVSEEQLVSIGQALDVGDGAMDRTMLSRMKSDGLDGIDEPLFPDLDQLYELLEQVSRESEA